MKLTKSKLKQIIKEELEFVLNERVGEGDAFTSPPNNLKDSTPNPAERFTHMSRVLQAIQKQGDTLTPVLKKMMQQFINPDGTFNTRSGVDLGDAATQLGDAYNELVDIKYKKDYHRKVN
jgi:hypothetical protein